MEGQTNFSLTVSTFIKRHVNVTEMFDFSWLHVNDMAQILKDLNLMGSTTDLTIKAIWDRYGSYSLEGGLSWATRWAPACCLFQSKLFNIAKKRWIFQSNQSL
jgi:hypothetical protein